jgi:hypothetical protein
VTIGDPPGTQWLKKQRQLPELDTPNFERARREMQLTPQEQFLYRHHLRNLYGSGKVWNKDGSTSTLLQVTVGQDGRTFSIPTVWDGKILGDKDAVDRSIAAGWVNWPGYASEDEAQKRYDQMHEYMDRDLLDYNRDMKANISGLFYADPK